ncbi:MAG: helix-turn-helix transcriptional regulator [Desulfovermiculus sp.]|nr:helix-turn-helix transcriptional regulator [Desulfovermiculus sp.]
MTASKHMGQTFDQFLQEDGIYEEVQLMALKKTISQQIKLLMNKEHLNKTEMAQRMGTSRSSLDRLLNDESSNITLNTINKAAIILGKRVDISLVDLHHQE